MSRQAAKVRLMDLGYSKAEGAYPFVDGQYAVSYTHLLDPLPGGAGLYQRRCPVHK